MLPSNPSAVHPPGLPRRNLRGEGGSNSIKVNQSDLLVKPARQNPCKCFIMNLLQNMEPSGCSNPLKVRQTGLLPLT
jgi:hypothetical protein